MSKESQFPPLSSLEYKMTGYTSKEEKLDWLMALVWTTIFFGVIIFWGGVFYWLFNSEWLYDFLREPLLHWMGLNFLCLLNSL